MTALPQGHFREFSFRDILRFDFSHFRGDLVSGLTSASLRLIGEIPRSFSLPHLPSNDLKTWSHLFPAGHSSTTFTSEGYLP